MSHYSNSLIKRKNLTQKIMDTFRKNGFIKVKMPIKCKNLLNLLEKINFYQCELTTTQNMKNIKNFRSQLSRAVLQIPAQQYTQQNIVDKIPENIEILFFFVNIAHR